MKLNSVDSDYSNLTRKELIKLSKQSSLKANLKVKLLNLINIIILS
jgi:hypothetical protein